MVCNASRTKHFLLFICFHIKHLSEFEGSKNTGQPINCENNYHKIYRLNIDLQFHDDLVMTRCIKLSDCSNVNFVSSKYKYEIN